MGSPLVQIFGMVGLRVEGIRGDNCPVQVTEPVKETGEVGGSHSFCRRSILAR